MHQKSFTTFPALHSLVIESHNHSIHVRIPGAVLSRRAQRERDVGLGISSGVFSIRGVSIVNGIVLTGIIG